MFICEDVPLALEDLESITDEELDSNVSQRHCPNVAASILEGVDESMLPDLGEDVQVSKRMRSALLSALEEELDILDERSPAMGGATDCDGDSDKLALASFFNRWFARKVGDEYPLGSMDDNTVNHRNVLSIVREGACKPGRDVTNGARCRQLCEVAFKDFMQYKIDCLTHTVQTHPAQNQGRKYPYLIMYLAIDEHEIHVQFQGQQQKRRQLWLMETLEKDMKRSVFSPSERDKIAEVIESKRDGTAKVLNGKMTLKSKDATSIIPMKGCCLEATNSATIGAGMEAMLPRGVSLLNVAKRLSHVIEVTILHFCSDRASGIQRRVQELTVELKKFPVLWFPTGCKVHPQATAAQEELKSQKAHVATYSMGRLLQNSYHFNMLIAQYTTVTGVFCREKVKFMAAGANQQYILASNEYWRRLLDITVFRDESVQGKNHPFMGPHPRQCDRLGREKRHVCDAMMACWHINVDHFNQVTFYTSERGTPERDLEMRMVTTFLAVSRFILPSEEACETRWSGYAGVLAAFTFMVHACFVGAISWRTKWPATKYEEQSLKDYVTGNEFQAEQSKKLARVSAAFEDDGLLVIIVFLNVILLVTDRLMRYLQAADVNLTGEQEAGRPPLIYQVTFGPKSPFRLALRQLCALLRAPDGSVYYWLKIWFAYKGRSRRFFCTMYMKAQQLILFQVATLSRLAHECEHEFPMASWATPAARYWTGDSQVTKATSEQTWRRLECCKDDGFTVKLEKAAGGPQGLRQGKLPDAQDQAAPLMKTVNDPIERKNASTRTVNSRSGKRNPMMLNNLLIAEYLNEVRVEQGRRGVVQLETPNSATVQAAGFLTRSRQKKARRTGKYHKFSSSFVMYMKHCRQQMSQQADLLYPLVEKKRKFGCRFRSGKVVKPDHKGIRYAFVTAKTAAARNRWHNDTDLKEIWDYKWQCHKLECLRRELLGAESGGGGHGSTDAVDGSEKARIKDSDTLWQAGSADFFVRPELVEAAIYRHAPGSHEGVHKSANKRPGFTTVADHIEERDRMQTLIENPRRGLRSRALPKIPGLRLTCYQICPGICLQNVHNGLQTYHHVRRAQTNFTTIISPLTKWQCVGTLWQVSVAFSNNLRDLKTFIVTIADVYNGKDKKHQWIVLNTILPGGKASFAYANNEHVAKPSGEFFGDVVASGDGRAPVKAVVRRAHADIPAEAFDDLDAWAANPYFAISKKPADKTHFLLPALLPKSSRVKHKGGAPSAQQDEDEIEATVMSGLAGKDREKMILKWRRILQSRNLLLEQKTDTLKELLKQTACDDADESTRVPDDNGDASDCSDAIASGEASDGDFAPEELEEFDEEEKKKGTQLVPVCPPKPEPKVPGVGVPVPIHDQVRAAAVAAARAHKGARKGDGGKEPANPSPAEGKGKGVSAEGKGPVDLGPAGPGAKGAQGNRKGARASGVVPAAPEGKGAGQQDDAQGGRPTITRGPRLKEGRWVTIPVYADPKNPSPETEIGCVKVDTESKQINGHCKRHEMMKLSLKKQVCHCNRSSQYNAARPGQGDPMGLLGAFFRILAKDSSIVDFKKHHEQKAMLAKYTRFGDREEGRSWMHLQPGMHEAFEEEASYKPGVVTREPHEVPAR